ncbi:MAG: nucleotidyltransferase family protein [Butyrivibrio sp.]|nr:nucleotidyltransferase family protein [Butyrivibrio sp.]
MKSEQESIIRAMSDHLTGRSTLTPVDLNWEELFMLTEQHQVSGIVYAQCKNPLFQHSYYGAIASYLKRKEALMLLEKALSDNDVNFFLVKGPVVAEYYPVPALRTMGDVDVVVYAEDRERVRDILLELGFTTDGTMGAFEWHFYFGNLLFELHDRLVYDEMTSDELHKAFFNDCWKYVKDGAIEPSFHFLYLLLHLRKHFINKGVGLRQFMDVAVMEREDLNWPWIVKKLRELELWAFSEKVLALNEVWFSVAPPFGTEPVNQSFIAEATELILRNGVFGFDNEENKHNIAVNIVKSEGSSFISRSRLALHAVFLPYLEMILMPQYSYLKNRKILLPLAWVHRAIRAVYLRKADKTMKTIMQQAFVSNDVVEKRSKVLEKWGL